MPPRLIGPYEILMIIGRGGVGTVYRARHRERGHEAALKLLAPPPACEPSAARRLAREFEALQGLDHPNVIRVYDAGVHEGYSYLAMELVQGLDLRSYLSPIIDEALDAASARESISTSRSLDLEAWSDEPDTETLFGPAEGARAIRAFAAMLDEPETDPVRDPAPARTPVPGGDAPALADVRPVPPALAERLNHPARVSRLRDAAAQVCAGLGYIHARGLVHRDLKPTNIMVDDERRVRLMDFGLVKLSGDDARITQHGHVVGTYRYMSPEQARGEAVDARADLYSLGVILYELLTGRPPFASKRVPDLWNQIIARAPVPVLALNPAADPVLARVAMRLLAKDPRERFQTASEVGAALV